MALLEIPQRFKGHFLKKLRVSFNMGFLRVVLSEGNQFDKFIFSEKLI